MPLEIGTWSGGCQAQNSALWKWRKPRSPSPQPSPPRRGCSVGRRARCLEASICRHMADSSPSPLGRGPGFGLRSSDFRAAEHDLPSTGRTLEPPCACSDRRLIPLTSIPAQVRESPLKIAQMNKLNFVMLKVVRWSGWPLLPLLLLFLLTGYIMEGRYGLSRVLDEKSALTFHRMLHVPLVVLVLAHSMAAAYLAVQRWGWIKHREAP